MKNAEVSFNNKADSNTSFCENKCLANDLNYIKDNLDALIQDLPLFSFKKLVLKEIFKILASINPSNIIFDEQKIYFYHQNQIEIYLKNFDCFGFHVQYAFNVNKFTNYIKENAVKPTYCNPRLFLQHFEDIDILSQLSYENENQHTTFELDLYKAKNPIVWFGKIDNENLEGFFVNGNHRVCKSIFSNVPRIKVFCVSNPFIFHDFLLNSDYKKLHKAMLIYMWLKRWFK